MRLRYLVIALALLAAYASDSWAQSKKSTSGKEISKTDQSNKADRLGTADHPLAVNVMPTAEQKVEAEKQSAESGLKIANDKKLVEYTGYQVLIGIVTFLIFLLQLIAFTAQAIYMRRSVAETRQTTAAAVDQANISRDNATKLQRSYIFVFDVRRLEHDGPEFYAGYSVANYGAIPAIIEDVSVGFVFSDRGEPPLPPRIDDDHELSINPIFPSGDRRTALREYIPTGMDTGSVIVTLPSEENAFGFDQEEARFAPEWGVPDNSDVFFRVVIRYRGPLVRATKRPLPGSALKAARNSFKGVERSTTITARIPRRPP